MELRRPKKLEGLAPRRKAAGMTQAQLAAALDVERPALAMWEIGQNWPSARILPAMADLLLCSIDDLYVAPEAARAAEGDGPYTVVPGGAEGATSSGPAGHLPLEGKAGEEAEA